MGFDAGININRVRSHTPSTPTDKNKSSKKGANYRIKVTVNQGDGVEKNKIFEKNIKASGGSAAAKIAKNEQHRAEQGKGSRYVPVSINKLEKKDAKYFNKK